SIWRYGARKITITSAPAPISRAFRSGVVLVITQARRQSTTRRYSSTNTRMTTRLTTAIAADWPISWNRKASLYMNVVVVSVWDPGPPPVMAQMMGNELKTLIMLMIAATRRAGRSNGSVMAR